MKLSRIAGISVLITAISFTLAACKAPGGEEATKTVATGVPEITSEAAETGVQTTTAGNTGEATKETTGSETSFSQASSVEVTTSLMPVETLPNSSASQTGTSNPAPTSTNANASSSTPQQTATSASASNGETTIPAPTTTSSGATVTTTTAISTAQQTTTVPETTIASAQKFWSTGENFGWQQSGIKLGTAYTGRVKIYFDITSPEKAGGEVGIADQNTAVAGYDDLIIRFRMNDTAALGQQEDTRGYFETSSGGTYDRLTTVYYRANITYHVELEVNFGSKTYDAWVITPESGKIKIAEGYGFNIAAADAADDIGQVFVISKFASDLVYIQNLKTEKVN